jgi:hypothetical protein
MREFVCGYQTLLTCAGEFVGLAIVLLVMLLWAVVSFLSWWDTRKARERSPHPETCCTPHRCDRERNCWMVPSCAKTARTAGVNE